MSTQMNTLVLKVNKQKDEIVSKNNELKKDADKICVADLAVKTAKVSRSVTSVYLVHMIWFCNSTNKR